jgi:hypothetical protein
LPSLATGSPAPLPPRGLTKSWIKFRSAVSDFDKARVRSRISAVRLKAFRILDGLEHHRLPPNISVEQALLILGQDPDVFYVEPNYNVHTTIIPNDTRFGELWGLSTLGQAGGTPGADIDAPSAWDVTTGSSNVVVAGSILASIIITRICPPTCFATRSTATTTPLTMMAMATSMTATVST